MKHSLECLILLLKGISILRTFALIVCAQRNCAGNATVICHALLRALVKLRFENLCRNRGRKVLHSVG